MSGRILWCAIMITLATVLAAAQSDEIIPVVEANAGSLQEDAQTDAPDLQPSIPSVPEPDVVDKQLFTEIELLDLQKLEQVILPENEQEPLRLTVEGCVQLALDANQDIIVVEFEPLKADTDLMTARGQFDPMVSASATHVHAKQIASSEIVVYGGLTEIEAFSTNTNTSLSGKLGWGTQYSVVLDVNKSESTYNNFFEQWDGGLTFTLTQPLLRGGGRNVNLARVKIAKNSRQVSEQQLRSTVMNTLADVIKAYWDLVGAIETLNVRREALENAERLLSISQRRLEIGAAAAIEVLQAKAGVATRQSDLIAARSSVSDAEDALKKLLNLCEGVSFASKKIVPLNRPVVEPLELEAMAGLEEESLKNIEIAMVNRPDIASAELDIENAKIEKKRAGNELLPQFDVSGSLSQGGRDHYVREVFEGIRDRDDNSYSVTVRGSIPIGNRAARGQYERADLTLHQARQRLEKAKQDAILQVRLALRQLNTSRILVESNQQTRKLQEINVDAEEKRLKLGVTTSYRVLEVQQDLTLAQTQELQAQINHEKALVSLRVAEGTLLDHLGITFEPPAPHEAVSFVRSVVPPNP